MKRLAEILRSVPKTDACAFVCLIAAMVLAMWAHSTGPGQDNPTPNDGPQCALLRECPR